MSPSIIVPVLLVAGVALAFWGCKTSRSGYESARTLTRFWLTVPVKISSHAHRPRARIFIPKASMRWWRLFLQDHYPKRKPGRPAKEPRVDLQES